MEDSHVANIPLQDSRWQLWYQDLFDPETPRQLESQGQGLEKGLIALWLHHLRDSVMRNGQPGFALFNLWFMEEKRSIRIQSCGTGMAKLKQWVLQPDPVFDPSASGKPNQQLLEKIVQAHCQLIAQGLEEEEICQMAAQSQTQEAFVESLSCI